MYVGCDAAGSDAKGCGLRCKGLAHKAATNIVFAFEGQKRIILCQGTLGNNLATCVIPAEHPSNSKKQDQMDGGVSDMLGSSPGALNKARVCTYVHTCHLGVCTLKVACRTCRVGRGNAGMALHGGKSFRPEPPACRLLDWALEPVRAESPGHPVLTKSGTL